MTVLTALALSACGASPSTAPGAEDRSTGSAAAESAPDSDVAWDDRVDFEPWQAPLPPGEDGWPAEPPSRWPEVRARLLLPPSVTPGETVDYVVVLRNDSDGRIDLRPCGGYQQEVMGLGPGLAAETVDGGTSAFRLSCDADPILMPGESRRYAMRVAVPPMLTGDEALFSWGFVDNMPDLEAQAWTRVSTS
ncbi:MAG: hypothetical protein JWO76_605 [Nocardioides sp.]|nr:hypothetical protein [Nocardioides sp.]